MKVVFSCVAFIVVRNQWWNERDRAVGFQVAVILILNTQERPKSTSECFTENQEDREGLEVVESRIRVAKDEHSKQPNIPQHEVSKDCEVVEVLGIADLVPQSPLASLPASHETPIHVNIPHIGVSGGHKMCKDVRPQPEVSIVLVLVTGVVCLLSQLEGNEGYHQVREILASVDQLLHVLLGVIVHLPEALSESPPVWDKA